MSAPVEGDMTVRDCLRLFLASIATGKTAGVGTAVEQFKSLDGSKDRLVVYYDAAGNRASITYDPN